LIRFKSLKFLTVYHIGLLQNLSQNPRQDHAMAGPIRHLLSRNGRFYARVAVPKALRSIVGKRELQEAIGAGRSEALRALPAAVARMQATIARAREEGKVGKGDRFDLRATCSAEMPSRAE
jgi:hypothetical protein